MLKELIDKGRISFHEGFENWEDAIYASCKPLIDDGAIEESYVDAIISNIKKYLTIYSYSTKYMYTTCSRRCCRS